MRLLVIGGGSALEVLVGELRQRGEYDISVLGADETTMSSLDVTSIAETGDVHGRLDVILSAARGRTGELSWSDPAWGLIEAVAGSDAVITAGGSCFDSRFPGPLAELLLVARLAAAFNKPLLLSGHSVGTLASDDDRAAVMEIISGARLAGLSDDQSFEWALLNFRFPPTTLRRTLAAVAFTPVAEDAGGSSMLDSPYVLVDLSDLAALAHGAAAQAMGGLLDQAAKLRAAQLLLVDSSRTSTATIVDAVTAEYRLADAAPAVVSALIRDASLVITGGADLSRMAVVAGVPVLAISTDEDTDRALTQALGDFGLAEAVVLAPTVATGDAAEVLERIAQSSAGRAPEDLIDRRRAESITWWDELHATIGGHSCTPATLSNVSQIGLLPDALRPKVDALRALQRVDVQRTTAAVRRRDAVELDAEESRIVALQSEMGQLAAERDAALAELNEAQSALSAAHTVAADVEQRLPVARPRNHVAAGVAHKALRFAARFVRRAAERLGVGVRR